jgi:membrane fusion protein, heavy metal efflux system
MNPRRIIVMNPHRMVVTLVFTAVVAGACDRAPAPEKDEPTLLNVTSWTGRTELYMEYPPLVSGEKALFAVHLTKLDDFAPLTTGRPTLEFTPESGGTPATLPGSEPSRPGAFRIEGAPPAAGRYRWALLVAAPNLNDRHDLGMVTVFADTKEATATGPGLQTPEDPAAIAYLKEQQWTNGFGTAVAQEAELRTAIRIPAVIEALTGGEAIVAAPASGRFTAGVLPGVGDAVRAGATLGRLEPRLAAGEDRAILQAAVSEAQAAADGARVEQSRAEQLLAERAVPARRLEDARRAVTVADARLHAAELRLAQRDETLRSGGGAASGNTFVLRAPISGRIAEVSATLGASYDEGAALFKIVRTDRVELRAHVPPAEVAAIRGIAELAFEIPGRPDPMPLTPHHMHDAGVLDAATKALPVQFEIENSRGELLIGQSGTAVLYKRERTRVPAVPKAAVLLEAGRPYVFVQVGGERFARRFVEIATRDGDQVGLKSGIKAGDRVVTRGAYDVQLASAAKGLPAEGHVH